MNNWHEICKYIQQEENIMKKLLKDLNKYKEKESNIKKILEDIYKKNKISENKEDITQAILEDIKDFEINEDFVKDYAENKEIEIEDAVKEIGKSKKEFFISLLQNQVMHLSEMFAKQKYFEKLEKDVVELKKEKIKLEAQLKEYIDLSSRLKKDYSNLTKRTEKEVAKTEENASKKVCLSIIDILDNFHQALDHFMTDEAKTFSKEEIVEGLDKINRKFLEVLRKEGVVEIESLNKQFDHNYHDALLTEEREDIEEDDTIIEEFKKGYMFKEEVLRPSLVKVGKKVDKIKNKED
ncbi:MAG: nucleotide exchange factor GrpE [Candidatus Muiribacterium halophilum]|uniref:Protein GrpE n=1 Tax=Muiribacterium halophilum TaxID=2053465 RepID=A0A2N5ZEY7_MUIH1|nr:MAG: nucleotide exchange factor GrpE [Candidatus Muirbacterium halophilum]